MRVWVVTYSHRGATCIQGIAFDKASALPMTDAAKELLRRCYGGRPEMWKGEWPVWTGWGYRVEAKEWSIAGVPETIEMEMING